LIVHIKAAFIKKFFLNDTSKVGMPSFHEVQKSSMSGCKYTSILCLGSDGPRIKIVKNINSLFMHMSGGRLYGVKIIGQQE